MTFEQAHRALIERSAAVGGIKMGDVDVDNPPTTIVPPDVDVPRALLAGLLELEELEPTIEGIEAAARNLLYVTLPASHCGACAVNGLATGLAQLYYLGYKMGQGA